PGKHLRRWNVRDGSLSVCSLNRGLNTSKEEQLVFEDGGANNAAKLIAFERILLGSERIACVEDSITDELEKTAMKFVGAALRDDIHDARCVKSILRGYCAGFYFEFLQRIGKGQRQSLVAVRIIVDTAVEKERHTVVPSAAYGND